ncbi:MAG: AMP-binding protein [Clostridia bacterium]|nr:AMP-binding protein [Clostridia bacterium]
MKLVFSTEHVRRSSFLRTCEIAHEYGYKGFEIYNALEEKKYHADSVLRSEVSADAKRKLRNRDLQIAALTYPVSLDSEDANPKTLVQYVDFAANAGIDYVVVSIINQPDIFKLKQVLAPAIAKAENTGVEILLETKGYLAKTQNAIELINVFSSSALAVCWNIRESFFAAGESPETGIKILGAYIRYVRIGDRKDGVNVLIGEGDLPFNQFVNALNSLNYDGFVCVDWNDEITSTDIVLTHFVQYAAQFEKNAKNNKQLQYNRSKTGTFPWKKYEVSDLTFGEVLDEVAATYPDQLAFRYTGLNYTRTYAQFKKDVDDAAAAFIALGVKPGYHVAIWAGNIPQWYICFWDATKIGAVLVTVNSAYKIHEIEYLLSQSDTYMLVMSRGSKEIDYKQIIEELCPELEYNKKGKALYSKKLPFLKHVVPVDYDMDGCLRWDEIIEKGKSIKRSEVERRASMVKPDDVCNMQYTSGTTGFPKGVMLTHRNIINDGKTIGDRMDMSTADRMMIQVPMFHCFGMVLSMTNCMTHGSTMCPMPYFSPKSSLATITSEKITSFNGVPTMFIAMFNHPDFAKTDFSHMRTGIMAGANCPPELMRRAAAEMNMTEILSVYGQTESAPGCTMGEVNEDLDHRVETVGSAFPGVECKIIDPETGEDVPDGVNGEFVARGYNIMKGYYKMPEATAHTIDADGWLHTGDLCCRTEDGYYKVTGRLKDMIIRGGENLYPREIEEFYLTHPQIRDVQVVGVPDEKYGEEACAWIILHDKNCGLTEADLKEYGLASMARHKVPRYFIFAEEFPMNAAGKILKYKMKDTSIEMLGIKA